MKYIPGTIIVTFLPECTEKEIADYLESQQADGSKVSIFNNRYAVDVPAGREEEYVSRFAQSSIVQRVNPHFIQGMRRRECPPKEEQPSKS